MMKIRIFFQLRSSELRLSSNADKFSELNNFFLQIFVFKTKQWLIVATARFLHFPCPFCFSVPHLLQVLACTLTRNHLFCGSFPTREQCLQTRLNSPFSFSRCSALSSRIFPIISFRVSLMDHSTEQLSTHKAKHISPTAFSQFSRPKCGRGGRRSRH